MKIEFLKNKQDFNFYINTFLNLFLKVFSIGANFLLVPILINTVGKEGYGVWQTILSFISWASILNFGFGNGLRNSIAKLYITKNYKKIGEITSSTIVICFKIILGAFILFVPVFYYFFDPNMLFINNLINENEIKISFIIFFCFFLLNIILGLSTSVAFGLQRSYLTGLVNSLYLLLSLLVIFILKYFIDLNLIHLSFIFGGIQSLVFLGLFIWENIKFKLNIKFKKSVEISDITRLSGKFFIVQLLSVIYLTIDNFVISSKLGASITAEYSVVNRIFFSIINVYSIFLIQFWNSVTEAFEKQNFFWIKRKVRVLIGLAFSVFIICLILSFNSSFIIKVWLGDSIGNIPKSIFYLFSLYTLFHCINAIFINIQNGIGLLRFQVYSILVSLSVYVLGLFIFNIVELGFQLVIILKSIGTFMAIGLNFISIKFLYEKSTN